MEKERDDDLYMLLAKIYIKDGNLDNAITYLEKMVDYDLNDYFTINSNTQTKSPLLRSLSRELYRKRVDRYQDLSVKLTDQCFESLRANERYQKLIDLIKK